MDNLILGTDKSAYLPLKREVSATSKAVTATGGTGTTSTDVDADGVAAASQIPLPVTAALGARLSLRDVVNLLG